MRLFINIQKQAKVLYAVRSVKIVVTLWRWIVTGSGAGDASVLFLDLGASYTCVFSF